MSALGASLRLDVLLQARHRLYSIGVVTALAMGLAGRFFFAPALAGSVLTIFYLTAIGISTYFFGAALVLLERSQGTLDALRTAPLGTRPYLLSKACTLGVFALLECLIVYAVAFWGVPVRPLPLVVGVVALGAFQTLVGLGQVAAHDSMPSFLIPGAVVIGSVLQLPAFFVLDVGPPLLWYLVPTQGFALLILGAFEPLAAWQWVYGGLAGGLSLFAAWRWARHRFARFVALGEG